MLIETNISTQFVTWYIKYNHFILISLFSCNHSTQKIQFQVVGECNTTSTIMNIFKYCHLKGLFRSFDASSIITISNKYLSRSNMNEYVPTHLDSLARFDSGSKWAWPNLTQAQLDSFWPDLTLLSPSQNEPGPI